MFPDESNFCDQSCPDTEKEHVCFSVGSRMFAAGCISYFAPEVIALSKFAVHNTVKLFKYINITGVCEICESFTISLSSFFFSTCLLLRNVDGVLCSVGVSTVHVVFVQLRRF
jgi:hypothetical protein